MWKFGDLDFGDLRRATAGCSDGLQRAHSVSDGFIFFHFHFPAKKSVQKGEVGSDPRAGYFFQRSSVPPRSPLHYQLENGGAITFMRYRLNGYTPRTRTTHAAHARTLSEDRRTRVRLNATGV